MCLVKNVEGLSVNEIDGKTVITAPRGVVYLSEFMNTFKSITRSFANRNR